MERIGRPGLTSPPLLVAVLVVAFVALPSTARGFSISGTVYEDENYGGGAGRSLATSSGTRRPGARAELYDGAGSFLLSTTSNSSGDYNFTGLAAGSYTVRVVNSSLTSSRTGYHTSLIAVQTYRTDASSGSAVAVTDHVGGEVPAKVDAGNGATTLAALITATTTAQSIAPVTIVVADVSGIDFGYSFNVMVNVNPTGQGSLHQFLTNADSLSNTGLAQAGRPAGIDNAVFMLADGTARPGLTASYPSQFVGGVATIAVGTAGLPWIGDAVILDAETQPGYGGTPLIVLDGSATTGSVNGIQIRASDCVIRGFVVHSFADEGVEIVGSVGGGRNNVLQNTWVGIDAAENPTPNGDNGVILAFAASGNLIGGPLPTDGNVISGNTASGLVFRDAGTDSNVVENNLIGVGSDGSTPLPNGTHGVALSTAVAANTIGGAGPGVSNTIAHNDSVGVAVFGAGAGNAVLRNAISANGNLGIDLGSAGVTVNDGLKSAGQPNLLMDHPVFTSAVVTADTLTVSGYVGNTPGQPAFASSRVEIYESDGDSSGNGEGPIYLGFLTSNGTDGDFSGSLTVSGVVSGTVITGTATDTGGNTSEFGPQATVGTTLKIVKRAYLADGTALAHGAVVPSGTRVKFLLYVNNLGGALSDASLEDVLDPGFQYVSETMTFSNAAGACASADCAPAEEDLIFAAADSGTSGTDAVDVDIVSRGGATLSIGDATVANAQLDLAAAKVWATVFTVRVQ